MSMFMSRHVPPCHRRHIAIAPHIRAVAVLATLATILLAGCGAAESTALLPTATLPAATLPPTTTPVANGAPVLVFFSKIPESLSDATAVFPAERVAPTSAVATFAIQLLIAGPTQEERSKGYFSELNSLFVGPSTCDSAANPTHGRPDFTLTMNKKGSTPEPGTAT